MIKEFEQTQLKKKHANVQFKPGMIVRVQQKILEGDKERLQAFEGLVIKVSSGSGPNKTITVRKVVGGVGVEKIIPIHSPLVDHIEIRKQMAVRRAKLYYMRDEKRTKRLYEDRTKKIAEVPVEEPKAKAPVKEEEPAVETEEAPKDE
ncbi:50S ribosomal protein L19 [Candidatus Peregrinibacteria bacterium CG11_big_fil_rev_8_21_14_0_20_46_8]|nr:MAG: 50S ribosomal protein L19 [Candidatus Peregrinibacteria bacterium CG11_big_fil_rev_8_21_14_0_20_46_8]